MNKGGYKGFGRDFQMKTSGYVKTISGILGGGGEGNRTVGREMSA